MLMRNLGSMGDLQVSAQKIYIW